MRVRGHPRATGCDDFADTANFDQICNTMINYARSFGIIRRNYIDSNSYNFSGGGGDVNKVYLHLSPDLGVFAKSM